MLKEIVKECIVEIFSESLLSESKQSEVRQNLNRQKSKRPKRAQINETYNRRSALDHMSYGDSSSVSDDFDRKIENTTQRLTSDPVMSEIFKDTAKTTLQNQISAESSKNSSILTSGDSAARKAFKSDPTELFAESANKWATLAFSD